MKGKIAKFRKGETIDGTLDATGGVIIDKITAPDGTITYERLRPKRPPCVVQDLGHGAKVTVQEYETDDPSIGPGLVVEKP